MNKYILMISAVYPPEPVVSARLSEDLYRALRKKGHEVRVIHPKPTRPYGFQFDANYKVGLDEIESSSYTCARSSTFGRARESVSLGRYCSKYIRKHHNDISMVYTGAWPLLGQFLVTRECVIYNIPTVTPVQDIYPESFSNKLKGLLKTIVHGLFLPMDKYILRHSWKIHVISERMRDYLSKTRNIPIDRFSVVVNWQDETEFLEYQNKNIISESDKFTFMYMGNIGPVAGVDLLIDAFEIAQLEDARLVVAGSGSMKESLKEKAKNNQNIEFWDVPNGKVPEIQSKADVMLLPIKKGAASSSIPSKLPAYMFSAKPIIGAMDADSDTANAIIESGGGYLVAPEQPEVLASMMRQLESMNRDELQEMGRKAQEYGLQMFSKRVNLDKLVNTIITVINGNE